MKFEPKAILFDMDGLLVDSEPLWMDVERAFMTKRGGEWTEAHATACIGQGLKHTFEVMAEILGCAFDEEACREELHTAFEENIHRLRLHRGGADLLAAAHGKVALAVGSSSARRLVEGVITALGVKHYFGAVVTGSDVPRLKPAPDVFIEAARRLNVSPADCVVLEDSLAGVRAARAAGARVIAVPEHGVERFHGEADHVAKDLIEARTLLGF